MYPEKCENSVVDENDKYKRRRCKVTGYLCRPTIFRNYGKSECIFEPQYLNRTPVKQLIKIIENLKPGMRVYWSYKTAAHTWAKTQIHTESGTIKEIQEDGGLVIAPDKMCCNWYASIHDITRSIKLKKEELDSILQKAVEELETEEQIRKESREDRTGEGENV